MLYQGKGKEVRIIVFPTIDDYRNRGRERKRKRENDRFFVSE
jgi:hypothetical protein